MNQRIAGLVEQIHHLETELEVEFARRRMELEFTVKGRVVGAGQSLCGGILEHRGSQHGQLKSRARNLLIVCSV